jgi:hypothetical protein
MSTNLSLIERPGLERRRSALHIRATDPSPFLWFNSTLVVLWIFLLSLVTVGFVFTGEAEYMALTVATQEAMFFKQLLNEFHHDSGSPITIHEDN